MRQAAARKWIIGVVLVAFLTLGWTSAQSRGFFGGGPRGPAGIGLGHHNGFGPFGFFPHSGFTAFAHPFTFGFHQPFLNSFVFPSGLRFSRGLADPDGFNFFAGPSASGFAYGPNGSTFSDPHGGWGFVEQWKDRQPQESQSGSLSDSLLLREGMGEEEVMKALGSPLRRVELGQRQVWQYSGYSLLFEGGGLKEIR